MKMEIKNQLSSFASIGIVACSVKVSKSANDLVMLLNNEAAGIKKSVTLDNFTELKPIADSRSAYTALGRNPSRYPVSSEALIKRILQDKGLYFINNVVEINNLISIRSGYSVGSYNSSKIDGEITFRQGALGEKYKGIGKAEFELENLPVLADAAGAFGSPTSDSERAMITASTDQIIMVIYGFGSGDLTAWLSQAAELLKDHAEASNVEILNF